MIATLTGTLAVRDANRIVVETVGVGYEVLIPLSTYYRLPPTGERVALEIRQVVRADALTLYGFSTGTEKRAFDLLMSVQHVGPKLALATLSVLTPEELVAAIAKGDANDLRIITSELSAAELSSPTTACTVRFASTGFIPRFTSAEIASSSEPAEIPLPGCAGIGPSI